MRTAPSHERRFAFGAVLLVSLLGLGGCTGSPETLALRPDFEVATAASVISVSMRQSLPGLTDEHFAELIEAGMGRAEPRSVLSGTVEPPFPTHRIVWHVDPIPSSGASRLVVNIFDGSVPLAYEQEIVANSAPDAAIIGTIESMTRRLMAAGASRSA